MLRTPSNSTLKKYGLTLSAWQELATSQGNVCFICEKLPKTNALCIDHEHVKNWKKQPSSERSQAVRGLLCTFCNFRVASKSINLQKAKKLVEYLERFETKKQDAQASAKQKSKQIPASGT